MSVQLVVLGAGYSSGSTRPFGINNGVEMRRVISWQLESFRRIYPDGKVTFVGGHQVENIAEHFPDLDYVVNGNWRSTGAVASLVLALTQVPDDTSPEYLFVLYSDLLVRDELFLECATQAKRGISVAIDPDMPTASARARLGESLIDADGLRSEFVGLVCIPQKDIRSFKNFCLEQKTSLNTENLSALFVDNECSGYPFVGVDARGLWSHAENSRAVAKFIMGTKAQTLARIQKSLCKSTVLSQVTFTEEHWRHRPDACVAKIQEAFGDESFVVVRSSARDEDGFSQANAGRYHSELNVKLDADEIRRAVDNVFASYEASVPGNEVLVQPQLQNVALSGVLFTRQLENGAPYYIINFVRGNDTTAVTGGHSVTDDTLVISRAADHSLLSGLPSEVEPLLVAARELEQVVFYDALDIEFAILADGTIVTLQCRPLMLQDYFEDRQWDDLVLDIQSALDSCFDLNTHTVLGDAAIWSVMADWNPAEIIGVKPSPLAFDLYRYVITDRTWAVQRREVGYRDLSRVPLVRGFGGTAFVDVRASLSSFVPADFPEDAAHRLVNDSLQRLRKNPALHDKIEFDVIPTCLDFSFDEWRRYYLANGVLTHDEVTTLESGLRRVTEGIMARTTEDFARAQKLEAEYNILLKQSAMMGRDAIAILLNQCRDEGALIFAHLARAGFVGVCFLKSAVQRCFISEERFQQFMASIETIGSVLQNTAYDVRNGKLPQSALVERYGHIRPGTYDITTPSYRQAFDVFLAPIVASAEPPRNSLFSLTPAETMALNDGMKEIGLRLDAEDLLSFVRDAVAGREFAKLVFTKLVSGALDIIRRDQTFLGVQEDDLPYLSLSSLLSLANETWSDSIVRMQMESDIARNRALCEGASRVLLPPVLLNSHDAMGFVQPPTAANFITGKATQAALVVLEKASAINCTDVKGKIVAIPNADPGYDFLFGLDIAGLVTAYGGPNSHMAIRAAEFKIPAAIGIGQTVFEKLVCGELYILDCSKKILREARQTLKYRKGIVCGS